jgi:hypothetical protein
LLAETGTVRPTGVFGWDRDVKTPVVYNFTAGVQRDIGFGTVVDIAYVGARSRHLERNQQVNTVRTARASCRRIAIRRRAACCRPISTGHFRVMRTSG